MTWRSIDWSNSLPITVIDTSTGSTGVTVDLSTLPDLFWTTVQAAGEDIRVTQADGVTELGITLTGFSVANRTGTLTIAAYDAVDATAGLLWLYYGNAAASAPAAGGAMGLTGYLDPGAPARSSIPPTGLVPRGSNVAQAALQKPPAASKMVWWLIRRSNLQGLLEPAGHPINGRRLYEEPVRASITVLQAGVAVSGAGVPAAAASDLRWQKTKGGALYLRSIVTGGTDGELYTLVLNITTSLGASRSVPALLDVRVAKEG